MTAHFLQQEMARNKLVDQKLHNVVVQTFIGTVVPKHYEGARSALTKYLQNKPDHVKDIPRYYGMAMERLLKEIVSNQQIDEEQP